jgi:hypothetical protein
LRPYLGHPTREKVFIATVCCNRLIEQLQTHVKLSLVPVVFASVFAFLQGSEMAA